MRENSINLKITQGWLEKSSESALEEFKSTLVDVLNSLPEDRHTINRWIITNEPEEDKTFLKYDNKSVVTLKVENGSLYFITIGSDTPRYDEILNATRFVAERLFLTVYSENHNGALIAQDSSLSLDNSIYQRDKLLFNFFSKSDFIPRYAPRVFNKREDGTYDSVIYPPYYAENKIDGSVHILNDKMLSFLVEKDDQRINKEFSYKVANSMHDFAKKHDVGLVPINFYQNYGHSNKIINFTYFDIYHINRKVFIDPYIFDYDVHHYYKYYQNVENGMHFMDKVRLGENLDTALKRVLREELQVADDYVGAKVCDIEFDRDRENILIPRLKINVFVHGMKDKKRKQGYDWVSIKK